MSKPKKRSTSSRKKKRASHFSLKKLELSSCPKCKKAVKPHRACAFCGFYNEKKVLKVQTKLDKTHK